MRIFAVVFIYSRFYIRQYSTQTKHVLRAHGCSDLFCLSSATVVLTGLEPNTTYEVRVAAINGKGQGEFSHTEAFQTLPIRKMLITSNLFSLM